MFVSKVVNFRYINNNYERSLSKIKGKEQLTWDKGLLLVNFWGKCLKKQLKHLKRKDTWIFLTKKSLELFNAHFLWCPTCKHRAIDKVSRVHTRTWERFKLNMFIIQLKKNDIPIIKTTSNIFWWFIYKTMNCAWVVLEGL